MNSCFLNQEIKKTSLAVGHIPGARFKSILISLPRRGKIKSEACLAFKLELRVGGQHKYKLDLLDGTQAHGGYRLIIFYMILLAGL